MILPVAVVMVLYEYELLLGAAAQVRKFYYPRMHSSKMTVKTGPAKTRPAGPLAIAMIKIPQNNLCVCMCSTL